MRLKSLSWILVGLASLVAVVVVAPVSASVMHLQFLDPEGEVMTDCTGTVSTTDGELIQKIEPNPNGVYVLFAEPGQKLLFDIGEPGAEATANRKFEKVAPGGGMMDVIVLGAPANDDCENAIALTLPADVTGSTDGAQTDPGAIAVGFCGTSTSNPSAGVWYTVEGTGTILTASLDNPGSDYDTKLTVFCDDCASLECVDGDDDGGSGLLSEVTFCTQVGATYNIMVHGFSTNTGNFQLTVTDSGTACQPEVDCLPPIPTGACCSCLVPPFNCTQATEADCVAQGSNYLGDDVACFGAGNPASVTSNPNVAIPDSNAVGVTDQIVMGMSFPIGDLDVQVDIDHTFIGDLIITLTHPDGVTTATLWNRVCGGNNDLSVDFDDQGGDVVCAQPTVGTYNPLSADGSELSVFNGLSSDGIWTIRVSDNAGADLGTLVSWTLDFESQGEPACPDTSGGDGGGDGGGDDECAPGKVLVCHVPPGNPGNQHEICISQSAVDAHLLEHGDDYLGECVDDDGSDATIVDIPNVIPGTEGGNIDLDAGDDQESDASRANSNSLSERDARQTRTPQKRGLR